MFPREGKRHELSPTRSKSRNCLWQRQFSPTLKFKAQEPYLGKMAPRKRQNRTSTTTVAPCTPRHRNSSENAPRTLPGKKFFSHPNLMVKSVSGTKSLPSTPSRGRAKAPKTLRKNNAKNLRDCVLYCLERCSLNPPHSRMSSHIRGPSRHRVSALVIWKWWKSRVRALGRCPSRRTISRALQGVDTTVTPRRCYNEGLSQEEFERLKTFSGYW